MPHTSHRKKKQNQAQHKREQVDDEGWTRVVGKPKISNINQTHRDNGLHPAGNDLVDHSTPSLPLSPSVTIETMMGKYDRLLRKWQQSESWKRLNEALEQFLQDKDTPAISNCFLFGSGTMSGLREGWIERHEVALLQTAVLKAVANAIGTRPRLPVIDLANTRCREQSKNKA
jgi:hypothetical protein